MKKYKNRQEVEEKYKWDLTEFYKDENDFNESYKKICSLVKDIFKYKGCTKDSNKLHEFLVTYINVLAEIENLEVYAYMVNDQELGKSDSIEKLNKIVKLESDFNINTNFFQPELLKLTIDEYNRLFEHDKLDEFKSFLDKIYREKEHTLSEKEQNIITTLLSSTNNFDNISSNLINKESDYGIIKLDGEEIELAPTNYRLFLKNKDVNVRREAYTKLNSVLERNSQTYASLLNNYVTLNNNNSKLHNFKNAWDEKLFNLNLSNKVFENLNKSCEKNVDILQKYFKLYKKVLKLDELHTYDLSLKLTNNDKEYSIDDATNLVRNSLSVLGDDYVSKYDYIIKNRHIDYCQYKGKQSGGYNISSLNRNSRILMSYNYDIDSVSTIAHECGHNVHHQYIMENNPLQYSSIMTIVSEVASLTNECLLSNYLIEHGKTKEEKLSGIENIMNVFVSNFYGAIREGKMEQDFYNIVDNGGTITNDVLNDLSISSIKKYYGDSVVDDYYTKNGWIRRSHYYMNFYLYSYAICISVASNVASKIINGDKEILNKYKKFLSCGSSKWPKDIFKEIDIDLENEDVYLNAIKYFNSLIDKFNEIYDSE